VSATKELADRVAEQVKDVLPNPRIVRSAEGGWALVWGDPIAYADIEVFDSGTMLAGCMRYGRAPDVFYVEENAAGIAAAAERIRAFLDQAGGES
jgi:hypothetical protein